MPANPFDTPTFDVDAFDAGSSPTILTGKLGTSDSRLGNIVLGLAESSGSGSFTADAVLFKTQSGSFTADAYITLPITTVSGSFTADSVLLDTILSSFSANAIIFKAQSGSFTADSYITLPTIEDSFTADSVLLKTTSSSFAANAILLKTTSGSKTADAILRKTTSRSFGADSYIVYNRMRHNRWTEHSGLDRDSDHILAQAFGVYLKDENMEAVLAELDARITAREQGYRHNLQRLYANAVFRVARSGSLLADAYLRIIRTGSFTADAIMQGAIRARAWISDSAIYISDSIAGAVDWGISTAVKGAFISAASLTHEVSDPTDSFTTDHTGWIKFTLSASHTVLVDTLGSQDYMGLNLFGPGSPINANYIAWGASGTDPDNPFNYSESITATLSAGTYYVVIFPYDDGSVATAEINIQITA
jgi:hypothetical protein